MNASTRVIVGLGNPGLEYAGTRHNIGFLAVDRLANALSWQTNKSFKADSVDCRQNDIRFWFVKPLTYMNNSGEAVAAILNYYKIEPKDLWVIHDDLDLPVGKAQIRFGGNTAGHHGLESIIEYLKTDQFGRVRIGIRGQELREQHTEQGIATNNFVMGRFTAAEQTVMDLVLDTVLPKLEVKTIKPETILV
jgi:PTH1 family peptidyl-tRNA hydrolase